MKKAIKKILLTGAIIIMSLVTLTGCNKVRYNAVLFDQAQEWMHEEFLMDNLTRDAREVFRWENMEEEPLSEIENERLQEKNAQLPHSRVHIVMDMVRFYEIFEEFPPSIDFENEMLIVFIFTNIYMGCSYNIRNIRLENEVLEVEFTRQGRRRLTHNASAPRQRCFVIRMDRQDISETNFRIRN